jgi:hypothetical protein
MRNYNLEYTQSQTHTDNDRAKDIDELLEEYRDYLVLYNTFGDTIYKQRSDLALHQIIYKGRR